MTTTVQHKDITGTDAVHPSNFYQSADPGAVGPNKDWLDNTTSPPVQKRRNAGDSGWDVILDPGLYQTKSLLTTLGDVPYATGSSAWARLAGNASATKKFLRQTGTGSVSAAPAWDVLVAGDIPALDASAITTGTFATARIPNLDASKITTGSFSASRLSGIEPNYYTAHINLAGGLDLVYILGANNTSATNTGTNTANRLYAVPFVGPGRGATIGVLSYQVTTLLAGNARVGIYDATSDSNLYPNNLIVDGGGLSTGTAGFKSATMSVALTPGKVYWAAYLADAAPTVRMLAAGQGLAMLGVPSSLVSTAVRGISVSQTYGALPATFPAGATLETTTVMPCIYASYSA